jgi:hypothetical protein
MRRVVATLLCILLSACADPFVAAAWRRACATEAGVHIYERPARADLALPFAGSGGLEVSLVHLGAASVEINVASVGERGALFTEGTGRYRVRLDTSRTPACQESLIALGYDPETLERISERQAGRILWPDDSCFSAERRGDVVRFQDAETLEAYLDQWESEYLWVPPYYTRTTRPNTLDRRLTVHAQQIVRRTTGEVVAESVSISRPAAPLVAHWGDPTCYGDGVSHHTIFPEPLFVRD